MVGAGLDAAVIPLLAPASTSEPPSRLSVDGEVELGTLPGLGQKRLWPPTFWCKGPEGPGSQEPHLRGPGSFPEVWVLRSGAGAEQAAGAGTDLGIVLRASEEGQLVGCGEVGSDLLHLPEALPLPPLGPPVLEPDLQDKALLWVRGLALSRDPEPSRPGAASVQPQGLTI